MRTVALLAFIAALTAAGCSPRQNDTNRPSGSAERTGSRSTDQPPPVRKSPPPAPGAEIMAPDRATVVTFTFDGKEHSVRIR